MANDYYGELLDSELEHWAQVNVGTEAEPKFQWQRPPRQRELLEVFIIIINNISIIWIRLNVHVRGFSPPIVFNVEMLIICDVLTDSSESSIGIKEEKETK